MRDTNAPPPSDGLTWREWLRQYRVPLLWALLLIIVLPMRDLWAPDEPDFAQCIREMRERGSWLLPYMNGLPYSEKPILFYWLMKVCAIGGEWITHGLGFTHGIAAWALRLPSVAGAIAFAFAFRAWIGRFGDERAAEPATLILCTTPIWFWESQFIQIDLIFCALIAWGWMAFLAGYLLDRGLCERRRSREERWWYLGAYLALALAFLSKGPLAIALSLPLLLAFLAWQRDWRALGRIQLGSGLLLMLVVISPWYLAAGIKGGGSYAFKLLVHENLERATHAWDHKNPWWYYAEYLVTHFFPWCLLLPALALQTWRRREELAPQLRFFLLASLLPVLLLSCSQSKQGKYIMMIYPFLALLLTELWPKEDQGSTRKYSHLLGVGLGLPALAMLVLAILRVGGAKHEVPILPFQLMLGTAALLMLACAILTFRRSGRIHPVTSTALGLPCFSWSAEPGGSA